MYNKHKITIVTITYNARNHLERTITSVINQSYKNIEYIIIDGSSKDNTINVIKEYEKYLNYWSSEPDKGIYDAMNKAINKATGEWIIFMNAGDTFCHNFILNNIFENEELIENLDVLYGGVNIIDEKQNLINYIQAKPMDTIWEGSYCNHQSLFVKTSIMKKYKFNINYKVAAEKDFFIKLYINNHKYKLFDFPISNFIISENSFSTKNKIIDSIEMLFILTKYLNTPEKIFNHNHYNRLVSYLPKGLKYSTPYNMNLSRDFNDIYDFAVDLSIKYSKIAIYGNSKLFKMLEHIFKNNIIQVYDKYNYEQNINPLNKINDFDFDIIFITVLGREIEISEELINTYKIDKNKIISLCDII